MQSKRLKTAASNATLAGQILTRQKPKPPSGTAVSLGDQILTPQKPKAAPAAVDQIWTPEKPEQLPPRRTRNRSVAFSVKEVRRTALSLRRAKKRPAPTEAPEEDELDSVERELGVGAGTASCLSPAKRKADVKLPERFEMLCEFFNCMEISVRLLRMKGSKATFPNICTSIQHLSERRFTYSHLAQLKYMMPEAIVVNKILLRDEITCCMRPDLQVNLLVDAVESNARRQKGETGYTVLRRIFRQRLVDFFRDHPEGDDIPEDELPHPFNQTRASVPPTASRVAVKPNAAASSDHTEQQPVAMLQVSHSFKRRFSQKSPAPTSTVGTSSPLAQDDPTFSSPLRRISLLGSPISNSLGVNETQMPEKDGKDLVSKSCVSEGTPGKFASTPIRLMAATPDLQTPKRPIPTTSYDTPPLTLAKLSARTKLFTTPTKGTSVGEDNQSTSVSTVDSDDEFLNFLPKSLLQSVKEKEKRALEEKEAGFADRVKRQKLIACLPGTFNIILLIYQSSQRSVMTKQELIHKIIASNPKIVDRGEVEEQLKLLQELIPDWISEKTARTGDILCCVNTTLSQADIRQRLYHAE